MSNAFSNTERKVAVFISPSLPHSIADFYSTVDELKKIGIHTCSINKDRRFLLTDNTLVYFRAAGQSLTGLWCDEMFGEVSQFDLYRLKDPSKPRYSKSLIEYIKKLEDDAIAEAFLHSELERLRVGGMG